MKNVINSLFAMLIMGIVTVFSLWFFLKGPIAGGNGLFQGIGNMLEDTVTEQSDILPVIGNDGRIR